ncbi:MAG: 50S ribosomal protein L22 [Actinobacteria bacterium]|nr:50S ribosomal protein L22 [Actinomycetota bacterium]
MLQAKAIEKYIRISPRKVKYVIDIIKNKPVEQAVGILSLTPKRAAVYIRKAVESAAANAVENFKEYKVSEDDLFIKEIFVTEGPTLKRFKPRARGRADRVLKRTSHITVTVSDEKSGMLKNSGKGVQKAAKTQKPESVKETSVTKEQDNKGKPAASKQSGKIKSQAQSRAKSQVSKKEAKN